MPQQTDLVERQCLLDGARSGDGVHPQRVQFRRLGARQAARQVVLAVGVHQKADRPAIHPVNRDVQRQHLMDRLQHEPVAAQRHDNSGLGQRTLTVAGDHPIARIRGDGGRGGDKGDLTSEVPTVLRHRRTQRKLGCRKVGQTRFLWSSTGMSRRTFAVNSWSMRAVVQPIPSETWATRWPHGLTTIEWP